MASPNDFSAATFSQDIVQLTLSAGQTETRLVLGHGVLDQAGAVLSSFQDARLLIVSDTQVAQLYAEPLRHTLEQQGFRVELLAIPAGESAKTIETLIQLYTRCQQLQVERRDMVLALGGGVVGDVAGMLAATYLRGLNFVQIPTTLVAQVTASIGGKVGVNFGAQKNLIGTFNQPGLVLIDTDTLATLPEVEYRAGLGELVTVGVLGAPDLFADLEVNGTRHLEQLILAAIQCKSAIVAADPFDQLDIRARLNLGHTFGHALEQLSDFRLSHGLAVAIGLHIASRLAVAIGLCPAALADRIEQTLVALNLPTTIPGYTPEQIIAAMRGDKKQQHGRLRWILPRALGQVEIVDEAQVPPPTLRAVLQSLVRSDGRES
ncbi:MAG TPA: 3-dehydroquinate synthase [Herpetosiphonaceae bacterium]